MTVGEGVEVEEQHAALVRLGCSMAQGYLHARPMPMDQLVAPPLAPATVTQAAAVG